MFDFDTRIDRRNTNSLKWNKYKDQDIIPLWVADTDFKAPEGVLNALQQRVTHGVFGYSRPSPRLIELVIERMKRLYQWEIDPEWLLFMPGVVPGLNFGIKAWCNPAQHVITPKPVYYPFLHAPEYNERPVSYIPMQDVDGRWLPDFDTLETLAKQADVLLLCNPHNPGGTIYSRQELEQIAAIAERNDLVVISDEIHCDLLLAEGKQHIPFAALSPAAAKRSAVLMAPSKTFNIAGLCSSFAIIPDQRLRFKLQQAMRGLMADNNLIGLVAAEAAYEYGDDWLTSQLEYLRGNFDLIKSSLGKYPQIKMLDLEATYLAWIDISALKLEDPIGTFEAGGVGLSPGGQFGDKRFVRLNFGCSRSLLTEALQRISAVIEANL